MPDLEITELGADGAAFAVQVVGDYRPTDAEWQWLNQINDLLVDLAKLGATAASPSPPDALMARDKFVALLRVSAVKVCATARAQRDQAVKDAQRDADWNEGYYTDKRDRIMATPFSVEPLVEHDLITDLQIHVWDTNLPEAKQAFKVRLDQAVTVVKTVFSDDPPQHAALPSGASKWARLRAWLASFRSPAQALNPARRSEYLKSLKGIAEVGLMNLDVTQTPFADLALTGFKNEFVAREAGRVKNRYVRRLGVSALAAAAAAVIAYAVTIAVVPPDWIGYRFRNFLILAAGAAVGTWLSFSIRRQVLSFEDLATLEDDRLNPGVRVLFMVALTVVVGLILWTGMVTVVIGNFNTDFKLTGSFAALIGALCGIAERSLTGAVSRRASELVAGIGGTVKPAG